VCSDYVRSENPPRRLTNHTNSAAGSFGLAHLAPRLAPQTRPPRGCARARRTRIARSRADHAAANQKLQSNGTHIIIVEKAKKGIPTADEVKDARESCKSIAVS
jgi:hypothetical protein